MFARSSSFWEANPSSLYNAEDENGVELYLYSSIRLRGVCRDSFTSLFVSFSLERGLANSKFTRGKRIILKFKVSGPHVILINKEEIFIKIKRIVNISFFEGHRQNILELLRLKINRAFIFLLIYVVLYVTYLLTS
jgi:hypothetical protein